LYKITKGIVVESRTLADGRRQIVGIRAEGDLCGYPSRRGQHLFTAEALSDVEACAFDAQRFEGLLSQYIDLARALTAEVSGKLIRATDSMIAIGQLGSVERVAHFLIELNELQPCLEAGARPINLYLTRQEIADYLGLTLETISRAFSKLRDMQLIASVGGDAVVVLDEERLRGLARL